MAISSPNVTSAKQGGQSPLDMFQQGIQLGSQFQALSQQLEQQRQFDVEMDEKTISEWGKDKLGLQQRIKENPDWFKNYLGKKYRLQMGDPQIDTLYNDLASGLQSTDQLTEIAKSDYAIRGGTQKAPAPEPTPQPPNTVKQPAPANGNLSATATTEVNTTPGDLPYDKFRSTMLGATGNGSSKIANDQKAFELMKNSAPTYDYEKDPTSLLALKTGQTISGVPSAPIDPVKAAYKMYRDGNMTLAQAKDYIYKQAINPQHGDDAALYKPPVAKVNKPVTTVVKNNVQVATIDNGVIKAIPGARATDYSQIYTSIKDQFYKDKTPEQAKDLVWAMNQKKLADFYGSDYAAKKAFDSGEWVKDSDKLQLTVVPPVDLTVAQQYQIEKQPPARVKAMESAEKKIADMPDYGGTKTIMTPNGGKPGGTSFMTAEQHAENWDYIKRNYGYFAKIVGEPGSPGWADRVNAMNKNQIRVIDNLSGGQGIQNLFEKTDPMQLEIAKMMVSSSQFAAEMDLRLKAHGLNVKELEERSLMDSIRAQQGWAELAASRNSNNPIDKRIAGAYDDYMGAISNWYKKNPNARSTNIVEVTKQSPESQGALAALNMISAAKYGGNVHRYELQSSYENMGQQKYFPHILEIHPSLLYLYESASPRDLGEVGANAPAATQQTSQATAEADAYMKGSKNKGTNVNKTE
jgi:hypothetical protein